MTKSKSSYINNRLYEISLVLFRICGELSDLKREARDGKTRKIIESARRKISAAGYELFNISF